MIIAHGQQKRTMQQVRVGRLEVVMDVVQQIEQRRYTYNIRTDYEIGEVV